MVKTLWLTFFWATLYLFATARGDSTAKTVLISIVWAFVNAPTPEPFKCNFVKIFTNGALVA